MCLLLEYLVLGYFRFNSKYAGNNIQCHDNNADKEAIVFGHFPKFQGNAVEGGSYLVDNSSL